MSELYYWDIARLLICVSLAYLLWNPTISQLYLNPKFVLVLFMAAICLNYSISQQFMDLAQAIRLSSCALVAVHIWTFLWHSRSEISPFSRMLISLSPMYYSIDEFRRIDLQVLWSRFTNLCLQLLDLACLGFAGAVDDLTQFLVYFKVEFKQTLFSAKEGVVWLLQFITPWVLNFVLPHISMLAERYPLFTWWVHQSDPLTVALILFWVFYLLYAFIKSAYLSVLSLRRRFKQRTPMIETTLYQMYKRVKVYFRNFFR